MAEKDAEPGSEIPADEQLRAGENEPTKVLPSDYVVVTSAEQIEKDRRAKPSNGPVKPAHLPKDTYVVAPQQPAAPKQSKAPVKPAGLPADSYVVVPEGREAATVPLGAPAHSATPAPVASGAAPQVVYVTAPVPPRPRGNRLFGVAIALVATVLFAVFFAITTLIIYRSQTGIATMSMLASVDFWIPVAVFAIAFIVATLITNRAGWWAHIIASLVVGAVVFLLGPVIISALDIYVFGLDFTVPVLIQSPLALFSALLAREIALWAGIAQSARGRRVKARNLEQRAAFDREQAESAAVR